MQTDHEAGQVSIFGPDLWYGKMCREPSQAENQKEQILRESSKKSVVYRRSPYLYLDRRMGHGLLPGLFWDRAWQPAGRILLGTDFSLCWRCLDAQYWGVPQRRKRIFLIADFAGRTADKVLFVREGLHGDTAPGV